MIHELAFYFTGPAVAAHSMGLSMGGANALTAKAFFEAREACGISGYLSLEEGVFAIRRKIEEYARSL